MNFLEKLKGLFGLKRRVASLPKLVRRSLYISIAFHVGLVVAAGSIIIGNIFYNREYQFKAQPPPMKSYDPRQLELKVKVQKQARSSSRPSMAPRLVSSKLNAGLTLPDIKVDPKIVKTTFQPKFKALSGTGLGAGLGTGYGLGGFSRDGVSTVNFFDIRAQGQAVAILVDVSISMVEDEKGGPAGFQRVRDRINKVIESLNEATMFNVMVFADACTVFRTNMVVATDDNKTKAKQWLRPFNTEGNFGLTTGNYQGSQGVGLETAGGTTRLDLPLDAAFEEGADLVLMITDGLPVVLKPVTADQIKSYQATVAGWQAQSAAAAQQAVAPAVASEEERVWVPPTPAQPARPPAKAQHLKEGQAVDQGSPAVAAQPGHWEMRRHGGGRPAGPPPPAPPQPQHWTLSDFVEHLKLLHEKYYLAKGKKMPVIDCIGYGIDKEGGAFLKGLSDTYKGHYRSVAKIE